MTLIRKNNVNAPADFEAPEGSNEAEAGASTVSAAPTEAGAAPAPAAPRATPSLLSRGAVAVKSNVDVDVLRKLKNAYTVQYDSLANLTATQGRFADRDSKTNLGSELIMELLSYQDQYVVSPNDDKANKELVRYSSDGVTCSDGTSCAAHLADLKEMGFKNARINARTVVVGAINATEKSDKFDGVLMQIDLSPKSKSQFDRYIVQGTFDLIKGRYTEEQVKTVRLTAEVAENAAKQSYTLVKFETYRAPAP